jgi:hypothetical protein
MLYGFGFSMPIFDPFIEVFWRSRLVLILIVEVFKLLWVSSKVLCWIPDWIWVIAFLANMIL